MFRISVLKPGFTLDVPATLMGAGFFFLALSGKNVAKSTKSFGKINQVQTEVVPLLINYDVDGIPSVDGHTTKFDGYTVIGNGQSYGPIGVAEPNSVTFRCVISGTKYFELDDNNKTLVADASWQIGKLASAVLEAGFYLPVVPGSSEATVGGCVAADVHGKNGHINGGFGDHLLSLTLYDPTTGKKSVVKPNEQKFAQTIGGYGATGIILDAKIRLKDRPGASMLLGSSCAHSPSQLLEMLDTFAVSSDDVGGWFTVSGNKFFSKVFWAQWSNDTQSQTANKISIPKSLIFKILGYKLWRRLFAWLLVRYIFYFDTRTKILSPHEVFFPLSSLKGWEKFYGASFIERQFLVPIGEGDNTLRHIVKMMKKYRLVSLFSGIKLFKGSRKGIMSFANEGWGISLQYSPTFRDFDNELTQYMIDKNLPEYLAKSQQFTTSFPAGYANHTQWFDLMKKNKVNSTLVNWLASERNR